MSSGRINKGQNFRKHKKRIKILQRRNAVSKNLIKQYEETFGLKLKEKVESKKIDLQREREFATEEEIRQESQCLENVKEMEIQAAIKHIKEEGNNNLKAYICYELSLKSTRHSGNIVGKKRSATRRLQDWIQYD